MFYVLPQTVEIGERSDHLVAIHQVRYVVRRFSI